MNSLIQSSSNLFFTFLIALFLLPSFSAEAQYIRSHHDSKVQKFADKAATEMQQSVCPISGSNAYASVSKWIYDEYQDHYEIHTSYNWTGKTVTWGDRQNFRVSGILTVSSNGRRSSFKQTYANSAVAKAKRNTNMAVGALIVGAFLVSESQN